MDNNGSDLIIIIGNQLMILLSWPVWKPLHVGGKFVSSNRLRVGGGLSVAWPLRVDPNRLSFAKRKTDQSN